MKEKKPKSVGWNNRRIKGLLVVGVCAIVLITIAFTNVSYGGYHPHMSKERSLHYTEDDRQFVELTLRMTSPDAKQRIKQISIIHEEILGEQNDQAAEAEVTGELGETSDFDGLGTLGPDIREKLHEHGPELPSQGLAERTWAIIFVTVIATCSIFFETFRELLFQHVPRDLTVVVEKFFSELATLGFIGTVTFVMIEFGILGRLSLMFTGSDHLLVKEFEVLHFLVFFIMVLFILVVCGLIYNAISNEKTWKKYQRALERVGQGRPHNRESKELVGARQLLQLPEEARVGRVQYELFKGDEARQAEFLLFRSWFILNKENEGRVPDYFDFAKYMSRSSAKVLSEVLEVGVMDWGVLWSIFVLVYVAAGLANAFGQIFREDGVFTGATCMLIFIMEVGLLIGTLALLRALLYAKAMLTPALRPAPAKSYGALDPAGGAVVGGGGGGDVTLEDLEPPRYLGEMKAVVGGGGGGGGLGGAGGVAGGGEESMLAKIFKLLGRWKRPPNRQEQLFGVFGAEGPATYLFFIRQLLLINIVVLAVTFTALYTTMQSVWIGLPWAILLVVLTCFALTPTTVGLYTWCSSVEQLKRRNIMNLVMQEQKHERVVEVVRCLSWLSFFVDQMELLKKMGGAEGAGGLKGEAVTETQWGLLLTETDPKEVEELEVLFDSFDSDKSGELEKEEVTGLMQHYLGSPMTEEEAARIFRVMDADGSGAVSFREFATVILHLKSEQKAQREGTTSFEDLAEKIFAIFDKSNDGSVSENEVTEAVQSMGKNWDTASVRFLFRQMDRDGSGHVSKAEFMAYMRKIQAEIAL